MLLSSTELFLSSKEVHLNSGARLLLELNCVLAIKHVPFRLHLGEINSAIHMYQFTSGRFDENQEKLWTGVKASNAQPVLRQEIRWYQ